VSHFRIRRTMRGSPIRCSTKRIATLERERAVTTRALTAADALAASVQAEATHATEKLAKLQADLASAEERIATLGQQLHEAVAARAIENREVAEANARAHGLSAKLASLEADAAKAQSRIAALEKETESAKVALAEADGRAIREENATQAQKRITELEKEAASTAETGAGSGKAGGQRANDLGEGESDEEPHRGAASANCSSFKTLCWARIHVICQFQFGSRKSTLPD
jgi:chromosome segregation ATPase